MDKRSMRWHHCGILTNTTFLHLITSEFPITSEWLFNVYTILSQPCFMHCLKDGAQTKYIYEPPPVVTVLFPGVEHHLDSLPFQ